jgi:hypothetical protein
MIKTLIEAVGGVIYVGVGLKVLSLNYRRGGHEASRLHQKAIEVEKSRWPNGIDDEYSRAAIRARERLYRVGLYSGIYWRALLWPLLIPVGTVSFGLKFLVGRLRANWSEGYRLGQVEVELARVRERERVEQEAIFVSDPELRQAREVVARDSLGRGA